MPRLTRRRKLVACQRQFPGPHWQGEETPGIHARKSVQIFEQGSVLLRLQQDSLRASLSEFALAGRSSATSAGTDDRDGRAQLMRCVRDELSGPREAVFNALQHAIQGFSQELEFVAAGRNLNAAAQDRSYLWSGCGRDGQNWRQRQPQPSSFRRQSRTPSQSETWLEGARQNGAELAIRN